MVFLMWPPGNSSHLVSRAVMSWITAWICCVTRPTGLTSSQWKSSPWSKKPLTPTTSSRTKSKRPETWYVEIFRYFCWEVFVLLFWFTLMLMWCRHGYNDQSTSGGWDRLSYLPCLHIGDTTILQKALNNSRTQIFLSKYQWLGARLVFPLNFPVCSYRTLSHWYGCYCWSGIGYCRRMI